MLNYLKKDYGFTLLLAVLLILSVLSFCKREESLSIEDRINAVEPAEERGTYSITIGSKLKASSQQDFNMVSIRVISSAGTLEHAKELQRRTGAVFSQFALSGGNSIVLQYVRQEN